MKACLLLLLALAQASNLLRQETTSAAEYWAKKKQAKVAQMSQTEQARIPCPNGRIPMDVVSMSHRYDRWDRMSIRWNGMMLMNPDVCIDMKRFVATNGAKDKIPLKLVAKSWNTQRNRKMVGNGTWYDKVDDTVELTSGERGCAASHVRLWKKVVKSGSPMILVEDDAIPVDDFAKKFNQGLKDLPEDADILYLGYSRPDNAPWKKELPGTDLAQAEYLWTTAGYMIWPSGAKKLLQRLPVNAPVDNFMSWASQENVTKTYAFKTPVVKQEMAWNLGSDIEHSDEKSKDKNTNSGDLRQTANLLLGKPLIEAQNSFHKMFANFTMQKDKVSEETEQTDEKSQSTKELEAIEAEQ